MSHKEQGAAHLLGPADAARLAGGRRAPSAFRAAADRGELRVAAITPTGRRLFEVGDVAAWLRSRGVEPNGE
jgi:hypothetical protein